MIKITIRLLSSDTIGKLYRAVDYLENHFGFHLVIDSFHQEDHDIDVFINGTGESDHEFVIHGNSIKELKVVDGEYSTTPFLEMKENDGFYLE